MNVSRRIQELFDTKIPVTRALRVKVEDYDGERLVLSAPLAENINHLGTAFGGSLNTLAVLAGYGLLWLELEGAKCHIVIRRSSISYDRPVRGELRATCHRPDEETMAEFRRSFFDSGKARITLFATIEDGEGGVAASRFQGTFVAMREDESPALPAD